MIDPAKFVDAEPVQTNKLSPNSPTQIDSSYLLYVNLAVLQLVKV